jgi:hypothetical protein
MPSISRSGVAVGTSNAVPADEDRNDPAAAAIDSVAAQPAAGSPPAPLKDADAPMERDVKPDRAEEENYALNAQEKKRSDDARAIREMPKTGPSRATGPRNVQNQQNVQDSNLGMRQAEALAKSRPAVSPNLRTAGGKKFEQRGGVWYDTAYRGQGTKTIRRGTEDFIRLDGGLRSIADSLGGTVVLVWNNKAYRIH